MSRASRQLPVRKVDAVLDLIASGTSAGKACDEIKVGRGDFFRMLALDEQLAQRYVRARAMSLDAMAEEALRIADTVFDGEDDAVAVQKARLQVDTRKWFLSKLNPKKYGDKTIIGSDPDNPLPSMVIIAPKEDGSAKD